MTDKPDTTAKTYRGFLFDMDGTLLTSIIAAERVWATWARRHQIDVATFLPTIHGKRTIETIQQQNLPGVDAKAEADWITERELIDTDGVVAISGVTTFLNQIPPERWAVVTSAPRRLALKRLAVAGLPQPHVLISAEDVSQGKPAPDCFLLGAKKLGISIKECLIFEDAPAGIIAAEASGADVLVVGATHTKPMSTSHRVLTDFNDIRIKQIGTDAWQIT